MAKISEAFGSAYLRAEDFDAKGRSFTIAGVGDESVGEDSKLVVRFEGTDNALPLNKTNALAIADLYGDDTDEWTGKVITVYRDRTMYQGKQVACLRVRK